MIFRNLFFAALIIGIISGSALSVIQQFAVTPIILDAEQYEVVGAPSEQKHQTLASPNTELLHKRVSLTPTVDVPHDHASHDHSAITTQTEEPVSFPLITASPKTENGGIETTNIEKITHSDDNHSSHSHDPEAWSPQDGIERTAYTFGANILSAIGFSLLMLGAMMLARKATPATGALWGLAGYTTFFIAPSLGLLPEIPGMEAAALEGRQTWWLLTVFVTATGFGLIAFGHVSLKVVGLALLATPHILGAPQPDIHGFANQNAVAVAALESLEIRFLWATAIANAVFWLVMGATSGYLINKFNLLNSH